MLKSIVRIHQNIYRFYDSSLGKKVIVAITGLMMVGFLLGHMLGNLQIFAGAAQNPEDTLINQYAAFLKGNFLLLWGTRIVMLKAMLMHVVCTIQLTRRNACARPLAYSVKKNVQSTFASRTMIFGGVTILLYVIYHLAHFTFGVVHTQELQHHNLYQSMVNSFQIPWVSFIYIVAQIFLGLHLFHGIQSTPRTLGISHPTYLAAFNIGGVFMALFISLGFSSIPIAVLLGFIN